MKKCSKNNWLIVYLLVFVSFLLLIGWFGLKSTILRENIKYKKSKINKDFQTQILI